MAISNYIPSSRVMQPGVCTSTTRPASPYTGMMIFETDTNLTYIWGGSAWQQVSGGTAVGNSGLVLVKSQTIGSTVTSVPVTNAFSSLYDSYKIVVSGGTASTNSFIGLQLGSSSAGYYQGRIGWVYGGSSTGGSDNNTARFTAVGSSLTTGLGAEITLNNPFLAKYTFCSGNYVDTTTAVVTTGVHQLAVSYTDFTLYAGSGSWSGGTITVYGYRK